MYVMSNASKYIHYTVYMLESKYTFKKDILLYILESTRYTCMYGVRSTLKSGGGGEHRRSMAQNFGVQVKAALQKFFEKKLKIFKKFFKCF